ncbi:MAG: aminodeoxychorismate/anthranilate synthase component II [Candidatus Sumerlaeaceae bacterium]|nr:aminodeoxychorismate/anthranilate synthase component II [Candidatus Sumerlaeaceae bacterium]
MILVIDNYDSFTYNLVQYLGEIVRWPEVAGKLGEVPEIRVVRNDKITVEEVSASQPSHIVISPGPCTPTEAGISLEVVRQLGPTTPLLGVCLGHQSIGQAFGGKVVRASVIMHGKTSEIYHTGAALFREIPSPFTATRYHSLIVERESLPECLEVIAWTEDQTIMALRHRDFPVWGVQFHPESILTTVGKRLLANFLLLG